MSETMKKNKCRICGTTKSPKWLAVLDGKPPYCQDCAKDRYNTNPHPAERSVDTQVIRFAKYLDRAWIPNTKEELEIFEGLRKLLVGFVETLLKQSVTEAEQRGRLAGAEEALTKIRDEAVKYHYTGKEFEEAIDTYLAEMKAEGKG